MRSQILEPYNRHVADWCAAMMQKLRSSASRPDHELPELDRVVNNFEYHFGDISAWPDDIVHVHSASPEATEKVYLGSLAALRSLNKEKGVSIAISLCAADMQSIKGRPDNGWKQFLQDMSIRHLSFDLGDPKTKLPGEHACCEEMAEVYFLTWQKMCSHLTQMMLDTPDGDSCGLLFHCFGGINRSSAALVAWLIFRHDLSAEAAIDILLSVRPSLRPWEKRPHVLWALKTWETQQASIHAMIDRMGSSAGPEKKARLSVDEHVEPK